MPSENTFSKLSYTQYFPYLNYINDSDRGEDAGIISEIETHDNTNGTSGKKD